MKQISRFSFLNKKEKAKKSKRKIKRKRKNFKFYYRYHTKIKNIFKIIFIVFLMYIYYYIQYIYFVELVNFYKSPIILDINHLNKLKYKFRELTKIIDNVTLVTSYFKIKSKHSLSQYSQWLDNFLQINHSMVFFVDINCYEEIIAKRPIEYRNITIWIKTNITDFLVYKNYFKEFNESYKIDIEKSIHTVPLYLVWAEKINFLKIATIKNYFKSKCFYWIDSGCFRSFENVQKFINGWPSAEKCLQDGRVFMIEVRKHSDYFYKKYSNFSISEHKEMQRTVSVDGSCFGGQKDYIFKFHELYYDALNKFIQHGIFIGKDQNIFAYVAYNNPDVIKLVYSGGKWFELRTMLFKTNSNIQ